MVNIANRTGKKLVDFLKCIDSKLEYNGIFGPGEYGLVLRTRKNNSDYRLKIGKFDEAGRPAPLEREYNILEDLSKTGAALKPIKLYSNVPGLLHVDKTCMPCKFYEGEKGKNAYLTEFIEGKMLHEAERLPESRLRLKLKHLLDKIHEAGYEAREGSDFNANNILLGIDGNLYMIDPLLLSRMHDKKEKSYMTKEEIERVNTIVAMYGLK